MPPAPARPAPRTSAQQEHEDVVMYGKLALQLGFQPSKGAADPLRKVVLSNTRS